MRPYCLSGFTLLAFLCLGAILFGTTLCGQASAQDDNTTAVSETRITLPTQTVYQGDLTWINGTIEDDRGEPIEGVYVHILWKRSPEIDRVRSSADGAFSLNYYVAYEERLGNVTVIASFEGDEAYMANETSATWTVRGRTFLKRSDSVTSAILGHQVELSARLFFTGSSLDFEGIYAIVVLHMDGHIIASEPTSHLGRVSFLVEIDPGRFSYGNVEVLFEYNGSGYYDGASNRSTLLIAFQGGASFGPLEVNERPFDPSRDAVRNNDSVRGNVMVADLFGLPLDGIGISVHLTGNGSNYNRELVGNGVTDALGRFGFEFTLMTQSNGSYVLVAECKGLQEERYPELAFDSLVPPPPTRPPVFKTSGDPSVEVGSNLRLEARVRNDRVWDANRLTYRLVSPPEGMEISPEGVITWRPGVEHVGKHDVTVWLYDGNNSAASTVEVTVVEAGGGLWGIITGPAGWLVGILIITLLATYFMVHIGRRGRRPGPDGGP